MIPSFSFSRFSFLVLARSFVSCLSAVLIVVSLILTVALPSVLAKEEAANKPGELPQAKVVERKAYQPVPTLMLGEVSAEIEAGDTVLELNFGSGAEDWQDAAKPNHEGRVTGRLPEDWYDDSAWAKVWVDYSQLKHDGIPFLRVDVKKIESGQAQLRGEVNADQLKSGQTYNISLKARSASTSALKFGIRDRGKPYVFKEVFTVGLTPEFTAYDFQFVAGDFEQPVGFYILISDVGSVEIESLTLSEIDDEAVAAWVDKRFPNGLPANLVRTSQFPLGLPSGWTLDRNSSIGDEVILASDENAPGVDGVPSLQLKAVKKGQKFRLASAPFELPKTNTTYQLSMNVKGIGELSATVMQRDHRIARSTWNVNDEEAWETHSMEVKAESSGEYVLLLESTDGSFWLDAFQISTDAGAFARQGRTEVHLAAARLERFEFADEPSLVKVGVIGAKKTDRVVLRAISPYDEELVLETPPLAAQEYQQFELPWHGFEKHPYGYFRIEAHVVDAKGERVSPYQELVIHRLRRPHFWGKDAPDSPFGVHTESSARHLTMAKAIGINWARLHDAGLGYIGWFWLEPEKGKWTFFDDEIKRYRAHDLKIFGQFGTAPTWASYWTGSGRTQVGYFDRFFQPRDLNDYRNYVEIVAKRYDGIIDAYDVWNEPWIAEWWGVDWDEKIGGRAGWITSKEPQKDFAKMMEVAYTTAKEVDSKIKVAGFNTTSGGGSQNRVKGTDWTQGVLDNGGLKYSDVIAFHMYEGGRSGGPGCSVASAIDRALSPLRKEDGSWPRPIWMTEGSHRPGGAGSLFYHHTVTGGSPIDPNLDSDMLVRYHVASLAEGVSRIFLYSMHAHSYFNGSRSARFNILLQSDGYLDPSCAAMSAMAWHLEGKIFIAQKDSEKGFRAYAFSKDGQSVVTLLRHAGNSDAIKLPSVDGVSYEDILGNPVEAGAELGTTVVYAIAAKPAKELLDALVK